MGGWEKTTGTRLSCKRGRRLFVPVWDAAAPLVLSPTGSPKPTRPCFPDGGTAQALRVPPVAPCPQGAQQTLAITFFSKYAKDLIGMSELKVDGINLGGYLPRGRPPNVYQFTHPNVFRVFTFSRGLGYAKYPLFVPSHRAIEVDEEVVLLHCSSMPLPPWTYMFHAVGRRVHGHAVGPVASRDATTAPK